MHARRSRTRLWIAMAAVGAFAGCALPTVTLGARFERSELRAFEASAATRSVSAIDAAAWLSVGYSLERAQELRRAPAAETASAPSDDASASQTTPCALDVACEWERDQRALELATWLPAIEAVAASGDDQGATP